MVAAAAGLNPSAPARYQHLVFVSLLSDSGMPIEAISRLVCHRNPSVAETVYRKQLRPVLLEGAEAMQDVLALGEG
ncbi:hypothetical protein [Nonomuraea candida]|uniref:hypothetical protein n=1 Tax=Nonomuraea candida TaxID=359159 RepID=UPI0005BB954F|nr:hypothetical protein [Nonomuraea candida]